MNDQVLYEKIEVYIHEVQEEEINGKLVEANKIGGRLQIIKNKHGKFIRFLAEGQTDAAPASPEDWAFVVDNSVLTYTKDSREDEAVSIGGNSHHHNSSSSSNANKPWYHKYARMRFDLNELSSVRRVYPGYGIPSIVFMLNDGHTWPPLYFYRGGSKDFLQELKQYIIFLKDSSDARLWSVQRPDGQAFQKSLYELSLFEEQQNDVVKKFLNQPLQSTFLGLSKVTNIFRDALKPNELVSGHAASSAAALLADSYVPDVRAAGKNRRSNASNVGGSSNSAAHSRHATTHRHRHGGGGGDDRGDDLADMLDSMTSDNIHSTNNDGYEMVMKVDLGPMPTVTRGPCVDAAHFQLDKDGRVMDVDKLKASIFRGGIEPSLRIDLWKYLLGYYDWNATAKTKSEKRKIRVEDYFRMKLQWKTINDEQKLKFSTMKERESLIEKDVLRTDRTNPYFEGDENANLVTMKDILMTYNMFNFDLGYVQGMSDLLAPIMVIMDNEVDAFWCFAGYMDKIESNFLMNQLNIKLQLSNLKDLIEFVDSKFSLYLEKNDSSNMYFCFRWILILFKREFVFPDVMKLWEVLWTDLPCKNFHLLICISILLMKKDDIMSNNYGFNEILKFINDLSFRIELEKTLVYAEGLYLQIKNFNNLPENIAEILGLSSGATGANLKENLSE